MGVRYTEWFDDLQSEDNYLIISDDDYALQLTNPAPFDAWDSAWMPKVIRRISDNGPGRLASWGAIEVEFGDDPNGAEGCCWSHALHGDYGGQLWNAGGDESEHDPAICRPLQLTSHPNVFSVYAAWEVSPAGPPPGVFAARIQRADILNAARALFFAPVRDNLGPGGVLNAPTPDDLGLPATDSHGNPIDYTFEWEGGDDVPPELLGIDFTTDGPFRPDPGDIPDEDSIAVALHIEKKPAAFTVDVTEDSGEYAEWPIGDVNSTPDPIIGTALVDHWTGGDPTWIEIPDVAAGDDGWDNCNDYTVGETQDEMAVLAPWTAFSAGASSDGAHAGEPYDIALRFSLRARRFRYSYEGADYADNPRRVISKDSPARVYPLGLTQGSAARVIGGAL